MKNCCANVGWVVFMDSTDLHRLFAIIERLAQQFSIYHDKMLDWLFCLSYNITIVFHISYKLLKKDCSWLSKKNEFIKEQKKLIWTEVFSVVPTKFFLFLILNGKCLVSVYLEFFKNCSLPSNCILSFAIGISTRRWPLPFAGSYWGVACRDLRQISPRGILTEMGEEKVWRTSHFLRFNLISPHHNQICWLRI